MCTGFINRHIQKLPDTEIFTTRHMLIYGIRSSVDSVLSRLVRSGRIHRLARGVFVRSLAGNPTLAQIVEAKVEAFCGAVVVHAVNILSKVFLARERTHTFAKEGSSSSFETIHGRAILKNQCARKMRLYQSEAGKAARALWHLDDDWVERAVDIATASFTRTDREMFLLASSLMPAWLVKSSKHRFPDRDICLRNPFLYKKIALKL
jgi:hypothetical protein